jgi:lambda family phage portal protein
MEKPHVKLLSDGSVQESIGGAYEGASRTSQEIAMWSPSNLSADKEISQSKNMVDARAKDMVKNDGYIAGAVDTHKDSIVGSQFTLNAKPNLNILNKVSPGFDEAWLEAFQQDVEAQFALWAESPDGWPDASRISTFTGLVRLAVGMGVYTGEVLASAEWITARGKPFKTSIQMIDVDRLSNPGGVTDTSTLVGGIEKDRFGAPIAYHIRSAHPSDWTNTDAYKWKRVKSRKYWGRRQIIHIFEPNRANQTRAVSAMVSTLKEMKMTKKYQDVVLQNAVLNATFAATIESELPTDVTFDQLGAGNEGGNAAANYMAQVGAYAGSSNNMKIDGAKIPHLWPGQKLSLQNTGNPGGVGDKFEQSLLRHVAASLGLSYEQFAKDFTQTNYSSARASMGETHKYMMSRKKMIADRFASTIYQLWFEEALNDGRILLPVGVSPSIFYEGQNKDALTNATWIGASMSQIDPIKETKAALMRIQGGISTYEIESAKLGSDFRDIFAQQQRENKIIKSRDLTFASSTADPQVKTPKAVQSK